MPKHAVTENDKHYGTLENWANLHEGWIEWHELDCMEIKTFEYWGVEKSFPKIILASKHCEKSSCQHKYSGGCHALSPKEQGSVQAVLSGNSHRICQGPLFFSLISLPRKREYLLFGHMWMSDDSYYFFLLNICNTKAATPQSVRPHHSQILKV